MPSMLITSISPILSAAAEESEKSGRVRLATMHPHTLAQGGPPCTREFALRINAGTGGILAQLRFLNEPVTFTGVIERW